MTLKFAGYAAFFVVSLGFWVSSASACSCSEPGPAPCPQVKKSGVGFVGTVIDIENPPDEESDADQSGTARYRFRVDENINGIDVKEVDVYSGRGGADCSYHFRRGETYYVNPYKAGDGRLTAIVCSRTTPIEYAEPMLSELRARRDGKTFASVFGVLRKTQQPYGWTESEGYDGPIPNATVELQGTKRSFLSQTDSDGIYRFYGIPEDTYRFAAELPSNLELAQTIVDTPQPAVKLPAGACFQQNLEALPTGRIRGRVIGSDGEPLENADVALFAENRYQEDGMGWWEYQDHKGHFEFNHVAPGRYILVFHNSNKADPYMPYPRTFYPGVLSVESAAQVVVAEGQQILDADIHLGDGRATRVVTVRVRWPGDPVPDNVSLNAQGADGERLSAETLSPGVFRVTIFRGVSYTIFAEQDCGVRVEGNAGIPIGARETERVQIGESDDEVKDVYLTLHDQTCKPYPKLPDLR